MFYNCSSLISLDISNFDTSKIELMNEMFYNCYSLTSLNLSHFDTSKVTNIRYMFYNCSSLTSLDLSNFNTSQVVDMNSMFAGCVNLEYINLKNFTEIKLNNSEKYYRNMFYNIIENIVICINENITNRKIFPQIKNKKCHVIDCPLDWKSKQKKIINNNNECIESCDNISLYQYEYNGRCYNNCTFGFLYDENNNSINKCKCELDKCLLCTKILLKGLCTKCNIDYFPKENDPLNTGEYFNCYKNPKGYYLDKNDSVYKKCYNTCETCDLNGNYLNHNCIKCNDNFPINIKYNNLSNCYQNCTFYYFFDKDNYNFHCTVNSSCPEEYPILNETNNECIKIPENIETTILVQDNFDITTINIYKIEDCENFNLNSYNLSINDSSNIDNDIYCKIYGENFIKLNSTLCQSLMNNIYFLNKSICINIIPDNYYYDINDNIYKKCYKTC